MTTISLRDYLQHINTLINHGSQEEAIFHCVNILKSYPKCVDVYRLLAKSLLENGKLSEAMDVFLKVLTVIPDDFSAHVGLSEIYDKDHQLDKAIWHMERAFESQPSNLLVQDELKKLFAARDGLPPAKIRLTRGALIRMYAKGELYQQAIAEAQSILEGDSERLDIKVLLAKMYQSSGSIVEAVDTCAEILKDNPYCLEANRIMREIELARDETIESSIFATRISEVEPYYGLLDDNHTSPLDVPDDAIILDKPDFIGNETEEIIPEWARQIGINWSGSRASETSSIEEKTEEISDFDETSTIEGESNIPFIETEEEKPAEPFNASEDELPDWIAKAGWVRASEEEFPPNFDESPSIELSKEDSEQATPAEELPDWLKSLNPLTAVVDEASSKDNTTPELSESDLEGIASFSTDELNNILGEDSNVDLPTEQNPPEFAGLPSEDVELKQPETAEDFSTSSVEAPDLPDWLKESDFGETTPLEQEVTLQQLDAPIDEISSEISDVVDESIQPVSDFELSGIEQTLESPAPVTETLETGVELPDMMQNPLEHSLDELIEGLGIEPLEKEEYSSNVLPPLGVSEEEQPAKPEVPDWVQKILGKSVDSTPSALAAEPKANNLEPSDEMEPLITDLPGEIPEAGAISDEVNQELMSWLSDINPDDALEEKFEEEVVYQEEQILPTTPAIEAIESSEISLDRLSEPSLITEDEHSQVNPQTSDDIRVSDFKESPVSEIDDRLAALFDSDITPTSEDTSIVEKEELTTETIAVDEVQESVLEEDNSADEELIRLLNEKNYEELSRILFEKSAKKDMVDEINNKFLSTIILSLVNDQPESLNLWKTIGDISLKKSDLKQALEAYKNAEKLLFQ